MNLCESYGRKLKCSQCGYVAELHEFDCGGLPDGIVDCPQCHEAIWSETGRPAGPEVAPLIWMMDE